MAPRFVTLFLVTLAISFTTVFTADPDPTQDVCVADLTSRMMVNGFTCKKTEVPCAEDFFTDILADAAATNSYVVREANVKQVPGLNTLGVSLSRIDYAVGGVNPPHTHPRATEVVFVLEGILTVGFITTSNQHIRKNVTKGHVFVFPRGLVHYQKNTGNCTASVISAFNSQLPGTQPIGLAMFGANPEVLDCVLAEAFKIGDNVVEMIKTRFAESY